jgi:protein required for attachment to host cells
MAFDTKGVTVLTRERIMNRAGVLVADRMRARLFEVEPANGDVRHVYTLAERVDLINTHPALSRQNKGEGSGPRSMRNGPETFYSGYDHEEADRTEEERQFAKEVAQEVLLSTKQYKMQKLLVIAAPKFLGALREHKHLLSHDLEEITELAKDLTRLSSADIRAYLEERSLV